MSQGLSAQQVVERIQRNLGAPWLPPGSDVFLAGSPDTVVTGIATTYAPTLDVLRRAVAGKQNLIITRESPFWDRAGAGPAFSGSGAPAAKESIAANVTFKLKQEFIASHGLVVWRFVDNWQARAVNGQVKGLAAALGWDRFRRPGPQPYHAPHEFFVLPSASLADTVKGIGARLGVRAIRVIGAPDTTVRTVALSHGFFLVPALQKILREEPEVDAIVIGEPVEWEASPYFQDVLASGRRKGLIILGQQASEDPGCGEMASWLRGFVSEVPVAWLPAGEPFWVLS